MSKQITDFKQKEEKTIVIPAALTHAPPAPQIPAQPIPPITPRTQTKPIQPEQPMPKEIKILLNGMEEIEDILYGMRQQISQLYGPVDYSHIEDIELCFPKEQADKLSFEIKGDYWIIKPKAYLGGDLFGKVAENVKDLGGEYVSAGKDSHFRVKRN